MTPLRLSSIPLLIAVVLSAQQPVVLLDGTPLRLRLARNVSSADAQVGETVDFEVLDEVKVGELIVVAKGAVALATVTEAQSKRRMGRAGKLNVNIDHVRMVNGQKAALRAVKEGSGGSNAGKMTGAIVATSIVFFPAAPLFLFVKGKDISIPKGTEITAYVNGDVRFEGAAAAGTGVAAPGPAPAVGKPMTNADVLALKSAGFSDDVIVSKIRSAPPGFKLDTADLIELKNAGLSDRVLQEMMARR